MNLNDYFKNQRQKKLSDYEKLVIYEKFLSKSKKKSIFSRFSFYFKTIIYTTIILLIFFNFINPTIIQENNLNNQNQITQIGTGYFIQKEIESNTKLQDFLVKADYIGTILEVNGDFRIIKNGQEIITNDIYNGDTILLMNNSTLKFQINSGVIGYIEGAAKLNITTIPDTNNKYLINLIEGNFFEIKTENITTDNVVIKTSNMEIESKKVGSDLNLKILGDGNKHIVENKGAEIMLKKVIKNEKMIASLKTNEKAEIDKDIKILKEVIAIKKQFKNNDLSASFALNPNNEQNNEQIIKSNEDSNSKELNNNNTVTEEIIPTDDIIDNLEVKLIIPEDKLEKLKNILYPNFIMSDIKNIIVYYLSGEKSGFDISYNNLSNRIYKIYELFEFKLDSSIIEFKNANGEGGIEELYVMTDQLVAKINDSYYVPTTYTQRLNVLLSWLLIIKQKQFGEFKGEKFEFNNIYDKLNISKYKENLEIK